MFIETLGSDPHYFFGVVITVVVSVCLHELAHGVTAIWLGDRTPIETGHMTWNPVVHMGVLSLVLLLVAGISWGSMPVDPRRLRGKYSYALVALAGPMMNVLIAATALLALGLWLRFETPAGEALDNYQQLLWVFGRTNIALAMFNLLPIPPLDGARIVANFSAAFARLMLQSRNLVFVLLLFAFPGGNRLLWHTADRIAGRAVVLLAFHHGRA